MTQYQKFYFIFIRNQASFNQQLLKDGGGGPWNTENLKNMSSMFTDAKIFNQDIGNWNTSNVQSMYEMFGNATSFNQPIGNWNTSAVNSIYPLSLIMKSELNNCFKLNNSEDL